MQRRIPDLGEKLKTRYSFEQIIGNSKVIKGSIRLARKVAPTDSTVLLEGETGTGKELFARSIHNASPRRNQPFIEVNCSAIQKDLLEFELFGYKKGVFTNANFDKKGLFEEAHEGTIFLDEIGDMESSLQVKLLKVLDDQSFTRIGDTKPVKVNVRIIATNDRDLLQESRQKRFRIDLYYRLAEFKIVVPPLRERVDDLEELANHFIRFYSHKTNKNITGMDESFFRKLKEYEWPGNTRELKNMIERAVLLCDKEFLTVDLLPYEIVKPVYVASRAGFKGTLEELEKMHIRKILEIAKGNKTKAAKILGIGIPTLYRKIEKYGFG
jgi:transcriptional regulator with PAS, ATPase and Fis domain